jgi:hypothetical protein
MNGYYRIAIMLPLLFFCAEKSPNDAGRGAFALVYEYGGARPAAGARVKFFESGDTGISPVEVCTTDENGRYSFERLRPGKYNVFAEKDSFVFSQEEVIISPQLTTCAATRSIPHRRSTAWRPSNIPGIRAR